MSLLLPMVISVFVILFFLEEELTELLLLDLALLVFKMYFAAAPRDVDVLLPEHPIHPSLVVHHFVSPEAASLACLGAVFERSVASALSRQLPSGHGSGGVRVCLVLRGRWLLLGSCQVRGGGLKGCRSTADWVFLPCRAGGRLRLRRLRRGRMRDTHRLKRGLTGLEGGDYRRGRRGDLAARLL